MNSQKKYTSQGVLGVTALPLDQDSLILYSCLEHVLFLSICYWILPVTGSWT